MSRLFNYNHDTDATSAAESGTSFFQKAAIGGALVAGTGVCYEVGKSVGADLYKAGKDWLKDDKKDDKKS